MKLARMKLTMQFLGERGSLPENRSYKKNVMNNMMGNIVSM